VAGPPRRNPHEDVGAHEHVGVPGRGRHRLVFAAAWLAGQIALIVTADRRPDGAFGFRMFSESSTIKLALYREMGREMGRETGRETGDARVHVDDGVWSAVGPDGKTHRVTWYDRVPSPFWPFDRETHASYGAATQLVRLQRALDDVAAHIPEDAETRRLVLDVTIRRNGREATTVQLVSRERPFGGGR
jgi:hypothetical protein